MCIGMRFGQLEVRTIATLILSRSLSPSPTTSTSRFVRCPRSVQLRGSPYRDREPFSVQQD